MSTGSDGASKRASSPGHGEESTGDGDAAESSVASRRKLFRDRLPGALLGPLDGKRKRACGPRHRELTHEQPSSQRASARRQCMELGSLRSSERLQREQPSAQGATWSGQCSGSRAS